MADAQDEVDKNNLRWGSHSVLRYQRAETDWDAIDRALRWTRQLRQLLQTDVPTPLRRLVERGRADVDADELEAALVVYRQAHETLTARFAARRQKELRALRFN